MIPLEIDFISEPIGTLFSTLFASVLIAGFPHYLLNPIIKLPMKAKVKRIWAIVIVLLLLVAAITWALLSVVPSPVQQISLLASGIPDSIKQVESWLKEVVELPVFKGVGINKHFGQLDISYGMVIQQFLSGVSNGLGSIVEMTISATVVITMAPSILLYMSKDGEKLVLNIQQSFPEKRRNQIVELLGQLNKILTNHVSGQTVECLFIGIFTLLGYMIVGVDYAFLSGIIAGLTNLIPYLRFYLGLAPAFLVTIFNDPIEALFCCLAVLIVQQLDGNIICPDVVEKPLGIHPLMVIIVLLVTGNIAGLFGIFLGIPFYTIRKTVISYIARIIKEDKQNGGKKKTAATS